MKLLTPSDFQKIDSEIHTLSEAGTRSEQVAKLRDVAELYRVYASRAALMIRELQDERKYLG